MTNRTAANRYARALMEVVLRENGDLERAGQELSEFVDLLREHAELQKVLLNPAIPAPRKHAAVLQLTTRAETSTIVSKLLALLAERDRLILLPDLLASYGDRLLDYRKVVRAELTTAAPLPPENAQTISHRLAAVASRAVSLQTKVDPSIIGGLIARIGSTVYDASVVGQLQKMKQRLAE